MTRTLRLAAALVAAMIVPAATAAAAPVVRKAAGANPAAIQAAVDAFRADLGGANNLVAPGPLDTGRREINWDGVPDASALPNSLPRDFFSATSPRGLLLDSPSVFNAFAVSEDDDSPADADPDQVRFSNYNGTNVTTFQTFSAQRLFTPVGTTVTDLTFSVPGTGRPATVRGFGAVFADVDDAGATYLAVYGPDGARLVGSETLHPQEADDGLSFLGISFPDGERIARVRIAAGGAALPHGH